MQNKYRQPTQSRRVADRFPSKQTRQQNREPWPKRTRFLCFAARSGQHHFPAPLRDALLENCVMCFFRLFRLNILQIVWYWCCKSEWLVCQTASYNKTLNHGRNLKLIGATKAFLLGLHSFFQYTKIHLKISDLSRGKLINVQILRNKTPIQWTTKNRYLILYLLAACG